MAKKTKAKKTVKRANGSVKKLYRSSKDKIIFGVCGGLGEYLNVDPTIVRLLWALATFVWGAGAIIYILAWLAIPKNPKHKW